MQTTVSERHALPKRATRPLLIGASVLAALVLGATAMNARLSYVPANLDYSTTRTSNSGLFKASYAPSVTPIPINRLHAWTLHLETPDGQPLENARISVDGDMPQHGHGLPTHPVAHEALGNGDYLVEGLKYQMGGWWVMDFKVTAKGQTDTVRFNMLLGK